MRSKFSLIRLSAITGYHTAFFVIIYSWLYTNSSQAQFALINNPCASLLYSNTASSDEFHQARLDHIQHISSKRHSIYEVLLPNALGILTINYYESFSDAYNATAEIPANRLISWDTTLDRLTFFYDKLVEKFNSFHQLNHFTIEHRLKNKQSVKDKVFEKARKAFFNGKLFSLSQIYDIIGIRIVFSHFDDMSHFYNDPQELISQLGLSDNSAVNVVLKGENNNKESSFYKAIHLKVTDGHLKYEIQIMSQLMNMWHHWDHDRVYKSKNKNNEYELLKVYTQKISKTIVEIEQCQLQFNNFKEFNSYIESNFKMNQISKKNRFQFDIDVALFDNLLKQNNKICKTQLGNF